MIECRLLGPIQVTVDGDPPPAELMWRKHLGLLIYLRHGPDRGRSRDHLMEMLWPGSATSAARHSLNEALRVLCKLVDPDYLISDQFNVRLNGEAVGLDLERFEQLEEAGDWESLSALICGDFAEGFAIPNASAFEDWLAAERLRWRSRSVAALVRRAAQLEATGDALAAVSEARRALQLDPSSESAFQSAVRGLALAGDRAGAMELSERFLQHLSDEREIEPGRATVELIQRVKAQEQAPERESHGREPDRTSRQVPLVGRGHELQDLMDAWHGSTINSEPAVLAIGGMSGSGKTRLLAELCHRMALEGASVVATRAVEGDSATPYSGLGALARGGLIRAPGIAAAPPHALVSLAKKLPEWSDRFGDITGDGSLDLPSALSSICAAAADEQPLVLAMDDANNLDPETLPAIGRLLRDNPELPITAAISVTLGEPLTSLDSLTSQIGRTLGGIAMEIQPLDYRQMTELAKWFVPSYSDNELTRLVRRVATDSAGLPLLAVELLHAVTLGLDLRNQHSAWPEPLKTLDQTLPSELPDALRAAIRVGAGRLPRAARLTLAAASIMGNRADPARIAAGTGLEIEDVRESLDLLERECWMEYDPDGYSVRARIVARVVGEDLVTAGQRRRIMAAQV